VLFVVLIIVLIILLVFGRPSAKKDGRYRDGSRGNSDTKFLILISGIATFLITTIVKDEEEENQIRLKLNNTNNQ
jgi:hypothetical protein